MNRILAILLWPIYWLLFPIRLRASVLIIVGKEILVVQNKLYYKKWTLPGGGVKLGENAVQAASREISEEIGISVSEGLLRPLNDSFLMVREFGITSRHKFFMCNLNYKPELKLNYEISEYCWLPITNTEVGKDVLKAVNLAQNDIL